MKNFFKYCLALVFVVAISEPGFTSVASDAEVDNSHIKAAGQPYWVAVASRLNHSADFNGFAQTCRAFRDASRDNSTLSPANAALKLQHLLSPITSAGAQAEQQEPIASSLIVPAIGHMRAQVSRRKTPESKSTLLGVLTALGDEQLLSAGVFPSCYEYRNETHLLEPRIIGLHV